MLLYGYDVDDKQHIVYTIFFYACFPISNVAIICWVCLRHNSRHCAFVYTMQQYLVAGRGI